MMANMDNLLPGVMQWVPHDSQGYRRAVELRYRVLRKPLGLEFTEAQLAAEVNDHHLVYLENGEVLGCLILTPLDGQRIKMRQVAVDGSRQGTGIGRRMVQYSERFAHDMGYTIIECHARETAVPFYLGLAWHIVSERFEEVGIPHFKMQKSLELNRPVSG
ncbi:MAG: GNAT family N-acetyltransferase [Chitinophagales bacterium]|nr:GNAT family N-acetyltransferase [Chitinophagales bacterium]